MKKGTKGLVISIIVFILAASISLLIAVNKGHIGSYSLIKLSNNSEKSSDSSSTVSVQPNLELYLDKEYLSSKSKEKSDITIYMDDEEVTDGYEIVSSDEKVAKISNNQVVAVSDGKATITVKYDDIEATATIRVITPISSMSFTTTNSTIRVGKELQMKLQTNPTGASVETLKYSSSDEDIATVSSNGIVKGVAPGKVTITVHDDYTVQEKSVTLTVKK